jgi:hypothetical protein
VTLDVQTIKGLNEMVEKEDAARKLQQMLEMELQGSKRKWNTDPLRKQLLLVQQTTSQPKIHRLCRQDQLQLALTTETPAVTAPDHRKPFRGGTLNTGSSAGQGPAFNNPLSPPQIRRIPESRPSFTSTLGNPEQGSHFLPRTLGIPHRQLR